MENQKKITENSNYFIPTKNGNNLGRVILKNESRYVRDISMTSFREIPVKSH